MNVDSSQTDSRPGVVVINLNGADETGCPNMIKTYLEGRGVRIIDYPAVSGIAPSETARAELFETALKLKEKYSDQETPDEVQIINKVGNSYLLAENFQQAIHWYQEMVIKHPEEPLGQAMLNQAIIEKLLAQGGEIDAKLLKEALEK